MTPHPSDAFLAGRRLMVGFDGTEVSQDLKYLIREVGVSGIILFKKNIESPRQIRELTRSAQKYALSLENEPLFIAVDQEGGEVARLRGPSFTEFPGNPADARRFAEVAASELASVGINMDMAPVLDVVPVGLAGVMAGRSFGSDPIRVSQLGRVIVSHLQRNGVMSVAKHFPGMGRALNDPHRDPAGLEISLPEMERSDLIPFNDAITGGVSGIMLSHLVYGGIDPGWPASLSGKIARDLLQEKMGFKGLVLTDDLDMGAIHAYYPVEILAERILEAQIDIALICHRTEKIENLFDAIRKAHRKSSDVKRLGIGSHRKISRVKQSFIKNPFPL
jgi:beta-N-acetylhexosaminidase